jgi:uncharacterized flavoprotein (TIGR03862 family)
LDLYSDKHKIIHYNHPMDEESPKNIPIQIAVIGAGPSGLMAADVISAGGYSVTLFDAMPSAGRKFLVAGKGGLNLTHSLPFDQFLAKYKDRQDILEPYLSQFGPTELREWIGGLGFKTFEGTSGRVFPETMNAGEILYAILQRLKSRSVQFRFKTKWIGWDEHNRQCFKTQNEEVSLSFDAVLFAFGGASWPQLGSDAAWLPFFEQKEIRVSSLKAANCGFETSWSDYFKEHYAGMPIKPVILSFRTSDGQLLQQQGEFIATQYGVEGSLIYAFSADIRDEIEKQGSATIYLDLAPNWSKAQLQEKLEQKRAGRSISSHLKKSIGLSGIRANLLHERLDKSALNDAQALAVAIKALPLRLSAARPLCEAISTAGGVDFSELDQNLMLKRFPGFFCAGEMLDWEAPTGGFLLTACFSSGYAAGNGILRWVNKGKPDQIARWGRFVNRKRISSP